MVPLSILGFRAKPIIYCFFKSNVSNDYGDMVNENFAFHDSPILRTAHS